jgi:hypothetical protein
LYRQRAPATSASPRRTELQMPWKAMLLSKTDGNVVIRAATAS